MADARGQNNNLLIKGGRVFLPDQSQIDGVVLIIDGRIAYVGAEAGLAGSAEYMAAGATLPVLDVTGCLVCPGFLDVHVHGGGGAGVMDATVQSLRTMARAHAKGGATGFLAGSVSAPFAQIRQVAEVVAVALSQSMAWDGAQVLGLHMEGPYLSDGKRGAHNRAYLRVPARQELDELRSVLGAAFRQITMAPELPGALPLIPWLRSEGVTVSLGHSEADVDTCLAAIASGANHATHIFNGMQQLHHRAPGLLGAALAYDEVTVELIADGIHVHPCVMRLVWQAKGAERVCLVTDAMIAMGMPPGRYMLGEQAVVVEGNICRLEGTDTLASSVLTMDRAVKNAVEMAGIPLADAVTMASAVPARQMGLANQKGMLRVGWDGDVSVLRPDMLCRATVVQGRVVYQAPSSR